MEMSMPGKALKLEEEEEPFNISELVCADSGTHLECVNPSLSTKLPL